MTVSDNGQSHSIELDSGMKGYLVKERLASEIGIDIRRRLRIRVDSFVPYHS